ncbi:MAG: hypothetical protein IPM54_21235 [Polyangiaceae bacterium]|nr:hypothetical protein [Polyangiaceae bacterium]
MDSFDHSLKYLLHQEPADFLRFGFGDDAVVIVAPSESALPSRGRDVDGSYLVYRHGKQMVAHVEFHRRHQSTKDLAVDVAEAQIRLYRREECLVESHVWDLYGDCDGTLTEKLSLNYGTGCCSTYVRINLRAMGWQDFLARAPPALWPLVALTRDGATGAAVEKARDAIEARTDRTSSERADHLAVLWFVAGSGRCCRASASGLSSEKATHGKHVVQEHLCRR